MDVVEVIPGSLGTSTSLSLRLGQTILSSAALLFMSFGVEFYNYTAFCFLVTTMGLVIPWSFTLAVMDGFLVISGCPLRLSRIIVVVVVGDWVLSILTLAAACSSASVINYLLNSDGLGCTSKYCCRYELSTAMAFMSWLLSAVSSLSNLWVLPSL